MENNSVVRICDAAGIEYQAMLSPAGQTIYEISANLIPSEIVDRIKSAPLKDVIPVSGSVILSDQVVRCKSLVLNPLSVLSWSLPETEDYGNFVVIAAQRLVINFPNKISEMAVIKIIPDDSVGRIDGPFGTAGKSGWTSGNDDGRNGGEGDEGGTGTAGRTYNYPNIFIFYTEIVTNNALPSIVTGLRIEGIGVRGGNGGRGGDGGRGGAGSRGKPGDRDCFLGICACSAGPGRGGNGGNGGPGGKGGDAGRGGNGASIFFVGPVGELADIERIEMLLTGAEPGIPGNPGAPGSGGQEGGGGAKPFECLEGGHSGHPGGGPSPMDRGPGEVNKKGMDGAVFTTFRNNSDLF